MQELVLFVAVIGYLIGSIPIGYLIGKKFGVNLLEEGSKAIGRTNLERVLAPIIGAKRAKLWGYIGEAGDQLKGLVPILIGMLLLRLDPISLAVLATSLILGHCYSAFLFFRGGKGVATTMGIVLALCWYIAVPCYVFWFAAKKALETKTQEATALASIRGGLLVGVLGVMVTHDLAMQIFFAFAALHIVFAHRENLKRYRQEQLQKKLEKASFPDDMPTGVFITDAATNNPETVKRLLMQKKKFAWLVNLFPAQFVCDVILPIIPMKYLKMGEVILENDLGAKVRVVTWGYPDIPRRMMENPGRTISRLLDLCSYVESLGADDICLGANTASVGDKGATLQQFAQSITNGNRLTCVYAVKAALKVLDTMLIPRGTAVATVVGSGGSVGDGVCQLLLKAGIGRLYLVGSTLGKQAGQATELSRRFGVPVEELGLMDALSRSHLAIFASSGTARENAHKINPEALPAGLIVVDMERPREISKMLAEYVWLLPNDGGMVAIEGTGKAGTGLPEGVYFPCFSELALRLFRGIRTKWCYPATLEELREVWEAAEEEGFSLAGLRLNEQPVEDHELAFRIEQAEMAKAYKPRRVT